MKQRMVLSVIIALAIQPVFGNYAFYKKVQKTCETYRVKISPNQMKVTEDEFSIELESLRNNFEMAMLVGFAGAGDAILHQKFMAQNNPDYIPVLPRKILVTVIVPMGRSDTVITASAGMELVEKLATGALQAADFMKQIQNSITSS